MEVLVNEAPLTRKREEVRKVLVVADLDEPFSKNMCFMSTSVTNGRGKAKITSAGMATQVGQIAYQLKDAKKKGNSLTPLQMALSRLAQNYIWDNRGGFTRSIAHDEGESVLLSVPLTADEGGEVRFVSVPPRMRLKKEKASRLDINLETQSLSVKYRDANESEATEEREKMATVLSDQIGPANEVGLVFQDGEWQIRDPQSRPGSFAASPQRVPASPVEQLSLEG